MMADSSVVYDVEPDTRSLQDIVRDFAINTSAHGLSALVRTTGIFQRLLWTCICIAAFVTVIVQVVLLAIYYFESPKYTTTEVQSQPIPFPVVSVCNLRGLDIETLEQAYTEPAFDYSSPEHLFDSIYKFMTEWQTDNASSSSTYYKSFTRIEAQYASQYIVLKGYLNGLNLSLSDRRYLLQQIMKPETIFGVFGTALIPYSTKKEEFIATCHFQYRECSHDNFEMFFNPYYYNCFSFNPATILGDDTTTSFTGPYGGLSLQIFAPTVDILHNLPDQMRQQLSSTYNHILSGGGIKVRVHGADEWPDIGNKGTEIPSGFSGSMALNVELYQRISGGGECVEIADIKELYNMTQYSETACRSYCIQNYIQATCNCTHLSFTFIASSGFPICTAIPELPLRCYHPTLIPNAAKDEECREILEMFVERLLCQKTVASAPSLKAHLASCQCQSPCEEYKYKAQTSLSQWPTSLDKNAMVNNILSNGFLDNFPEEKKEKYFSRILRAKGNESDAAYSANLSEFMAESHFIRLNVYFADTSMVTIAEHPSYEIMQLISDIGGQMGLWMGLSIITLAEVLCLVLTICKRTLVMSRPTKKISAK